MVTPAPVRSAASAAGVPSPPTASRASSSAAFGGADHAWPALLALTQASRDLMALAISGQARDSAMQQAQAFANRDAAAALLFAMKSSGRASQHAMQADELHCWYADAHCVADVASHAVTAFQQLTASASAVPATAGVPPAHAAGAPAHVYIGDIDSSPCTPRGRSSVADDDGTVTSFTPIKHPPPVVQDALDAHASGASALLGSPLHSRFVDCLGSEKVCGRLPRPPEARSCALSPTPACSKGQGGTPGSYVGDCGIHDGADGIGACSCSAIGLALHLHCCDSARPPGQSPRPPEVHLCAKYALATPTDGVNAGTVEGAGSVNTVAKQEANSSDAVDSVGTAVAEAAVEQTDKLVGDSRPPGLSASTPSPWWRLPLPLPFSSANQLALIHSLVMSEGKGGPLLQASDDDGVKGDLSFGGTTAGLAVTDADEAIVEWDWYFASPPPALAPTTPLPWWCLPRWHGGHVSQAPRGRGHSGEAVGVAAADPLSSSLPMLEPVRLLSQDATQDFSPPPQGGAAQSASLRMLEPGTHPPCVTTLDLGAPSDVASDSIDLPPMSPPDVSLLAEEVCGRLPRPPEARTSCDAQAASLPSSSHLPPSHVGTQDNGPTPHAASSFQAPADLDGGGNATRIIRDSVDRPKVAQPSEHARADSCPPGVGALPPADAAAPSPPQPIAPWRAPTPQVHANWRRKSASERALVKRVEEIGAQLKPSTNKTSASACLHALAVSGDCNCANEVDPGCLHSRSCANELGPDGLRDRCGVSEDVLDLMSPSDATDVANGCAHWCANDLVPDSGSCGIDPAVTAPTYISSGVPI